MLNEPAAVIRRIAADTLLFAAAFMVVVPASAQQRLSLADLQAQIIALQAQVTHQQAEIAALKSNSVLTLNGLLDYDAASQTARFTGIDVQIVNGATPGVSNGRGNLIVGNNALCTHEVYLTRGDCVAHGGIWQDQGRQGSHNLVVGSAHSYDAYGGTVLGIANEVRGSGTVVSGGSRNTSDGFGSSVSGGLWNRAAGNGNSVSGGLLNSATSGDGASVVSGGWNNLAAGFRATVSGGVNRAANGDGQWVAGSLSEAY